MDMLEEAVQYVKALLDAVDVEYIDYAIKFRESGYYIMHRINIKYHSPILFSILDSGAEDIEGIIDFDEGRINLFCLSIKEEHQYIYDYKGYNAPGTTLCGYVRAYLDNEHIEYYKHDLIRTWKEIVARNDLQMYSKTQNDNSMKNMNVKRILNNIYGRGGRGNLASIVLFDEAIHSMQKISEEMKMNRKFEIKKVIFNDPATIILWGNGDKTVVKCRLGDEFDPEKGLAMAISKYVLGNNYEYYNTFKHYLKPYSKKESHDAVDVLASNLNQLRNYLEEVSYLGKK
jgi:hypothetical protein